MIVELVRCPLCDPYQYKVYASSKRATVPEENEVYHPSLQEWTECPLCFSTGHVAEELSAAFLLTRGKLDPMSDTRPHYFDLVQLRRQVFALLQKGEKNG